MSSVGGIPSSRYSHHMRTKKIGTHPAIEGPYPPPDTNPRDGSHPLSLAHDRPTVGDAGSGATGAWQQSIRPGRSITCLMALLRKEFTPLARRSSWTPTRLVFLPGSR